MFNPLAIDSPPPDIPMPEVFSTVTSWTYSASPFVSPALNAKAGMAGNIEFDPDTIVIPSPDKVQVFDTPGTMEYVLLPPPRLTDKDPTGMKAMMDFLGFKGPFKDVAAAGVDKEFAPADTPSIPVMGMKGQQARPQAGPPTHSGSHTAKLGNSIRR
jgi:hypothetical protein